VALKLCSVEIRPRPTVAGMANRLSAYINCDREAYISPQKIHHYGRFRSVT
jgi:hypothetical protein